MASYTPDATYPAWSSQQTADHVAAPRRVDPRRPLVAFAVTAMVCAGLVLVPADAAADEVTVEEFALLGAGGNQGNQGNQDHPGQGDPCGNTGNPCCDNEGDGNPNEQTPGNAGGGCNSSDDDDDDGPTGPVGDDDDDDGPTGPVGDDDDDDGPQGPAGPVGDDDDDSTPPGDDDDDDSTPPGDDDDDDSTPPGDDDDDPAANDDPATDDDPAPSSPADPTPLSDDPSTTPPPEVLGVVEEHEPEGPSGAEVLGRTEQARAVPEALAFTGPAGAVPMALGGSSFMAAGVAMMLAGRRRRPEDVRQAWWERVTI